MMVFADPEAASQASIAIRRHRQALHRSVDQGASLAAILEAEDAILDVPLCDVLRWLPNVGARRAAAMLRGLPAGSWRSLTREERALVLVRVRTYERHWRIPMHREDS